MRRFFFLRNEDVNGHSGLGVVAEGVIFGDGTGSYTWLTKHKTITTFVKMKDVIDLHGHQGRTEIVVEGVKRQSKKFDECSKIARDKWLDMKSRKKADT